MPCIIEIRRFVYLNSLNLIENVDSDILQQTCFGTQIYHKAIKSYGFSYDVLIIKEHKYNVYKNIFKRMSKNNNVLIDDCQ